MPEALFSGFTGSLVDSAMIAPPIERLGKTVEIRM
jgi:hypothetical protein